MDVSIHLMTAIVNQIVKYSKTRIKVVMTRIRSIKFNVITNISILCQQLMGYATPAIARIETTTTCCPSLHFCGCNAAKDRLMFDSISLSAPQSLRSAMNACSLELCASLWKLEETTLLWIIDEVRAEPESQCLQSHYSLWHSIDGDSALD